MTKLLPCSGIAERSFALIVTCPPRLGKSLRSPKLFPGLTFVYRTRT